MTHCMLKTLWGVPEFGDPNKWPAMFSRIAADGFGGVEIKGGGVPVDQVQRWKALLKQHGLVFVSQIHTCDYVARLAGNTFNDQGVVGSEDFAAHLASFTDQVRHAKLLGAVHCNSHSGHDAWSLETMVKFLQEAVKIEKAEGITVSHETHRRRIFFNPHTTVELLTRVPEAKITADLSHWCVIMERIPSAESDKTWPKLLELVASRVSVIHARVGYSESPQVPDPSAPEYAFELKHHIQWWSTMWKSMAKRGLPVIYIEPEHGPTPYLQHMPHTKAPNAELWEVNTWVGEQVERAFVAEMGGKAGMRKGAKPRAARTPPASGICWRSVAVGFVAAAALGAMVFTKGIVKKD